MLDNFTLREVEGFLQKEGKKSPLAYQDSAARQERNQVSSTLNYMAKNIEEEIVDQYLIRSVELGLTGVVGFLLDVGANKEAVDRDNKDGDTVLMVAALSGRTAIVEMLLENGASKEAGDCHGNTALMAAALYNQIAVVEVLLKAGAEVDAKSKINWTALIYAADEGHQVVAQLLLKAGASIEVRDSGGYTALMIAANKGHLAVVEVLLKAAAKVDATSIKGATALIFAATEGHAETVDILLKTGAKKEARDSDGDTALMCAALYNQIATVKVLLKSGAEVDATSIEGATALIYAAMRGHTETVEILLNAGANKEIEDKVYGTALTGAARMGHRTVVELLSKAGANKEAKDYDGDTALMSAAYRCHAAVVEVLLRAGAEVDAVDNYSETALSLAISGSEENDVEGSQKENTVKALISYGANPFLRVGNDFMNHNPENPLAGYSEDILNYIALSEHTEGFCAAASTDSPELKAIKADMSKRCSRMSALRSIYQQELDCYQSTCALNTTARSIHPSYDTKESVGHNLNDVEVDRPQVRQRSDDTLRTNLSHDALSIVSLNMFLPISVDSADDANEKCSASKARARFFSSVRKRMAAKYQAALVEKQLVSAGDVVEFTAIESEAVLQKMEANISQQAQREDAMSLAP